MKNRLPVELVAIAVLQVIPLLILPPNMLAGIKPVAWGIIVVLFGLLAFNLLRKQGWARMATIFMQGFNIIVRILILLGHAAQPTESGIVVDTWLLGSFVLSIIGSLIILYYVDRPEVQMAMQ